MPHAPRQHALSSSSVATVNAIHELDVHGFDLGVVLGAGTYATVRKVYSRRHSCHFAVKTIDVRQAKRDYREHFMPRELEIIKTLRHPNVLRVVQIIERPPHVMIVSEWVWDCPQLQKVRKFKGLEESVAKHHFRHIIEGLSYLHERHIAHRDLKCENVLLDKHDNVKLGDFGFARVMDDLSSTFCGSRAYAAPEILQAKPYTGCKVDIWSAGVVLFIMLTGVMPFDERNTRRMVEQQLQHKLHYPSPNSRRRQVSPIGRAMIGWLLSVEPHRRPTIQQICAGEFLRTTQWMYRTDDTVYMLRVESSSGTLANARSSGSTPASDGAAATADTSTATSSASTQRVPPDADARAQLETGRAKAKVA